MVRRLTAIMFTDMVGYTVLMQEDEGRAKAYRDRQREVLEAEVALHGGQVVQYYGDGTLSSFPSAVEAVLAANDIQRRLSQDPRIPLRIGIHLGDVVHDEHGVLGDGVNVAARVQAMAVPGSVFLSDRIQEELANHPELPTRSLGRFKLKNVYRPVELHCLELEGLAVPSSDALPQEERAQERSVAVLPFVNMSADPENEFFADGITEEILNALTRVEGLQVTARTSSFAFKGQNRDVREIATELGVSNVLEGSVRKAGNRVRITAQLIEAASGYHLFSETYDSSLDDIFATQDEISAAIQTRLQDQLEQEDRQEKQARTRFISPSAAAARAAFPAASLRSPVPPAHQLHSGHSHTRNPEAYTEYLKGRYHWQKWSRDGAAKALAHLERSAELDPSCALPFSALAHLHTILASIGEWDPADAYPRAAAYARHAIELEPDAGEGVLALGVVKAFYEWEFQEAHQLIMEAVRRMPGSADAHGTAATSFKALGRMEESVKHAEIAVQLDPLSLPANRALALSLLSAGRIEEAEIQIGRVLALDPNFMGGLTVAGWIRMAQGDVVGALAVWERMAELMGEDREDASGMLGLAYGRLGRTEEARAVLELIREREAQDPNPSWHNEAALVHWGLGELDQVFERLNKAVDERLGSVIFLATSPNWAPLRSDPRFKALIARIGNPAPAGVGV